MEVKNRRLARRLSIRQQVQVRGSDPKEGEFEDLSHTQNASQRGIYFLTQRMSYRTGMRLHLTIPFISSSHPKNREYFGQVTRVDPRENGHLGIAVQFL